MAGLLWALPGLSFHFGLKKADIGALTPQELNAYLGALEDLSRSTGGE